MNSNHLDQIREKISIVDVISQHTTLKLKGREYTGCCPFHKEKTASFFVNPHKGFYYCFGCGAKGNIFSFYTDYYKQSFPEALQNLAEKAGITLPSRAEFQYNNQKNNTLYDICTSMQKYYEESLYLKNNEKALTYLRNRNLSNQTIKDFNLGYASDKSSLDSILTESKAYDEDILEIGIKSYKQNGEIYTFFRNRIIFPIKNTSGKIIAFGGRTLSNDNVKYLNTKESKIFSKKNTLYGLYQALPNLKDETNLIIVEGYMDVISLHQHGFKTAVSPLGTSISENHIALINKYNQTPIFCLDGDKAGIKATKRIINLYLNILEPGLNPKFILLPQGEDPDSFIKSKTEEDFKNLLSQATTLSQTLWQMATEGASLDIPEERSSILHNLLEESNKVKNKDIMYAFKSFFKGKIQEYGKLANNILYSNYSVYKKKKEDFAKSLIINVNNERAGALFLCIVSYPDIYAHLEEKFGNCNFEEEKLEELRLFLIDNSCNLKDTNSVVALLKENNFYKYYLSLINTNSIKPILVRLSSAENALDIFNSTYNLLLIDRLQLEKKQTLNKIKEANLVVATNQEEENAKTSRIKTLLLQENSIREEIQRLLQVVNL